MTGPGVLAALDDEAVADAIEEMEPDTQVEVLEDLTPERAADILEEMRPTTRPTSLPTCPTTLAPEILALMEPDEAEEVGELLAYPEDTAGGIMTTEFMAVPATSPRARPSTGCASSSPTPRPSTTSTSSMTTSRLVGVLSLRDLIVAQPSTPITEVMIHEPVAVGALADQDEVAGVVAHYNLLAVPVVDAAGGWSGS